MKIKLLKIVFLLWILMIAIANNGFAQYSGQVSADEGALTFSTSRGYDVIRLPGAGFTEQVGAPQLPVLTYRYVIPYEAVVTGVNFTLNDTVRLADTFYVYPAQPPVITDGRPSPPFAEPDTAIYNHDKPYPANVIEIAGDGYSMGYHIVTIYFYPVKYYPYSRLATLIEEASFTINYTLNGSPESLPLRISESRNRITKDFVRSIITNTADLDNVTGGAITVCPSNVNEPKLDIDGIPGNEGDVPDYIIITHSDLAEAFQPLADWKTRKGVPAVIVTTGEIMKTYNGVDSCEKIRNYLKDARSKWGDGLYVLLGGDVKYVPVRYCGVGVKRSPTDQYYSCLNGNWNGNGDYIFGDYEDNVDVGHSLFIGRAPANNIGNIQTFINKIMAYEMMSINDRNYVKNSLFISTTVAEKCEVLFGDFIPYIQNNIIPLLPSSSSYVKRIMTDNHDCSIFDIFSYPDCNETIVCPTNTLLNVPKPDCGTCPGGDYELSEENAVKALNGENGEYYHLIYHLDHSGYNALGMSAYYKGEALTIADVDGLQNGNRYQIFYSKGCSANAFHLDGIGEHYINNSSNGGVAFIGGSVSQSAYNEIPEFKNFCNSLYNISKYKNIGGVFCAANDNYTVNLLGDPEMPVWTDAPDDLQVSLPASVTIGQNNVAITLSNLAVNDKIRICLQKEGEIYEVRNADVATAGTHSEYFTVNCHTTGNVTVTVTGINYIPFTGTITVNPSAAAHMYISNQAYLTSMEVNAGQTLTFPIALTNSGSIAAANVNATLTAVELSESFEGGWMPEGWKYLPSLPANNMWNQNQGTHMPANGGNADGYKLAYFKSGELNTGEISYLRIPLTKFYNSNLSFWMYHDNGYPNADDVLRICKYNPLVPSPIAGALYHRNIEPPSGWGWQKHEVSLNGILTSINKKGLLAFMGESAHGNDIHIDDVRISSPFISNLPVTAVSYGSITAGNAVSGDFQFTVDKDIPDGTKVHYILDIAENGQERKYRDDFTVVVKAPEIIPEQNIIVSTSDGDKNIEAGEQVTFSIGLRNTGSCVARSLHAELQIHASYANFTNGNSESDYLDIYPENVKYNTINFVFTVNGIQSTLPFLLTVTDQYQKQWKFEFDLMSTLQILDGLTYHIMDNTLQLSWNPYPVLSVLKGYNVYRFDATGLAPGSYNPEDESNYQKLNTYICEHALYNDADIIANHKYYYKVSAVNLDGNESPLSASCLAGILPMHEGWPVNVVSQGGRMQGSPVIYDIDGTTDQNKEIFINVGNNGANNTSALLAFKSDGSEFIDKDNNPNTLDGFKVFANTDVTSTPVVGYIDGSTTPLIMETTLSGKSSSVFKERALCISPEAVNNEPPVLWEYVTGRNFRGAVASDLNSDSKKEIFCKGEWGVPFYTLNSEENPSQRVLWSHSFSPTNPIGLGMPVVGDINGNTTKEIIEGFVTTTSGANTINSGIYVFNADGTSFGTLNADGRFFEYFNKETGIYDHMDCTPVLADIDANPGNGNEIICVSGRYVSASNISGRVFILRNNNGAGECIDGWDYDNANHIFLLPYKNIVDYINLPSPAIGDINHDGSAEIVIAGKNYIYVWNNDGTALNSNFPIYVPNLECGLISPLLADVDGDDDLEVIIVTSNNGYIYAYNIDGSIVPGFPIVIDEAIDATPCIGDIDNDGLNELIVAGHSKIYCWDTQGEANKTEWGMFRGNSYNNAVYDETDECTYSSTPFVVNNYLTWDTYHKPGSDIQIRNGATLIVQATVAMPEDGKIIVERGGQLIVEGNGKLTNACKGLWQGVQVIGNSGYAQLPTSRHGLVTVRDGGTIENAVCGIKSYYAENESGTSGGIVYADNANFINNVTAVSFLPYDYNSISYFDSCTFETTHSLLGNNYPDYFIKLDVISGVEIKGCTFRNSNDVDYRGSGVFAYSSGFSISEKCLNEVSPCTEYVENTFENLDYGIYAVGKGEYRNININHCNFSGTYRSMYISALNSTIITENHVIIPSITKPVSKQSFGLGLFNCTGYHVEANSFTANAADKGLAGIYVSNSGTDYNEVYNNAFENLVYGTVAYGINRNGVTTGLCYKCNDFTNCDQDIAVTRGSLPLTDNIGIAASQGQKNGSTPPYDPTLPAGNVFSSGTGHVWDLYNDAKPFIYVHHIYNEYYKVIPADYTTATITLDLDIYVGYNKSTACPSKLGSSGGSVDEDKALAETAGESADSTQQALAALVDGGSTEDLTTEVMTSTPPEALETTETLLAGSPYLSDTVMTSAVYKEEVLPNAMIRDILVANPQSAKSEAVLTAVDNRVNPMPEEMMAEIMQNLYVAGAKERMEQTISAWKAREGEARANVIRYYLHDMNTSANDSLLAYTGRMDIAEVRYNTAVAYMEKGDSLNAEIQLNGAVSLMGSDPQVLAIHADWVELLSIIKRMKSNGDTISMPDSTQTARLENLMNNSEAQPGVYARNMLVAAGKLHYDEVLYLPEGVLKMAEIYPQRGKLASQEALLQLFPNPAKDYVIASYKLGDKCSNAELRLSDGNGKVITNYKLVPKTSQKTIPLTNLTPGNYYVSLITEGNVRFACKFSKTR